MAIVNASGSSTALNLTNGFTFAVTNTGQSLLGQFSPNLIVVYLDNIVNSNTGTYSGFFTYVGNAITSNSVINSYAHSTSGLSYSLTGISIQVGANGIPNTYFGFLDAGNSVGLRQFLLSGADSITGSSFGDVLYGDAGDDTINGGLGNDTLIGGVGNDTFVVDSASDVIVENSGEGADTVQSAASYSLAALANVEHLTLTGLANINGTGNASNNAITGNAGNNVLDGGAGNDTLTGGAGNDTYLLDSALDVVSENQFEGTDEVQSNSDYALGNNVENLILLGAAVNGVGNALNNAITGNVFDNTLSGFDGSDTLDGGAGSDTLVGGLGDDTYWVDVPSDVITENLNAGTDHVRASSNYVLGNHLENLTLLGAATAGTGNSLNNAITGNALGNTLSSLDGDDTLDGAGGNDTLLGGAGNDTYLVDSTSDSVTENLNQGTDLVLASANYVLGNNLENLVLFGGALDGTGNTLTNVLTGNALGNTLIGLQGNDTLDGAGGNDTLVGGAGDDAYFVDSSLDVVTELSNEGVMDTVLATANYALSDHIENLTLLGAAQGGTGNAGNNTITGNALANTLAGLAGDDTLVGGAGDDTMNGGPGNDTYIVSSSSDVVTENADEGVDLVLSSVSFTLSGNVENLELQGVATDGTGNGLNNVLTATNINIRLNGLAGNDTLIGTNGFDSLDGGAGADFMSGGLGFDTYVVDDPGDVVVEVFVNTSDRFDLVKSSISYTLPQYAEWLTLLGNAPINGFGTSAGNEIITGNDAANVLHSGGGVNDELYGQFGDDTLDDGGGFARMFGGPGDDTYHVGAQGSPFFSVQEFFGEGLDTVFAALDFTLGSNVENLTLVAGTSATGNALNNMLVGNDGDNFLDGGVGADTMRGGLGNDSYTIDDAGDVVIELTGEGDDDQLITNGMGFSLVGTGIEKLYLGDFSSANVAGFGNELNNFIRGTQGANLIEGRSGNDTLMGGSDNDALFGDDGLDEMYGDLGDDVLIGGVGADTLDGGAGTDTAIGQDGDDVINGDDGVDLLYGYADNDRIFGGLDGDFLSGGTGNDTLNGGAGDDAMHGEDGDDLLTGEDGNDVLVGQTGDDTLNGGAGGDTLIGDVGNDALDGDADNDQLFGYAGLDTLSGGDGADFLSGGDDNDQLAGDAGGDVLDGEAGDDNLNGGADGDNLNGGLGNDTVSGGDGADGLLGWDGDDVLDGGTGSDYMFGDQPGGGGIRGNDRFVFQDGTGNDSVLDFQGGAGVGDVIDLRGMGFANFAAVQAASSNLNGGVYLNLDAGNPGGIAGDALFIANTTVASLAANDFLLV